MRMSSFRYVPPTQDSPNYLAQSTGYKSGALTAAFQILDTNRQGFFPKDILLHILTRKGDRKLDPDFVEGVLDEVSIQGRVYYKDLCELFREASFQAENKLRETQIKQSIETIPEEVPVESLEKVTSPLLSKPKVVPEDSFGDSDDSYPSLEPTPVATPTDRRDSASLPSLPLSLQDDESINDANSPSIEHLEELPPNLSEYVTKNALHDEAAMQSAEEIPELLKQAESCQN